MMFADVVGGAQQADAADEVLLVALFQVAASGIGISLPQRRHDLLHRNVVGLQFRKVQVHLVLLHEAAEGDDVGNARREAHLALDHPVLQPAQLGEVVAGPGELVAEELADRGGQRRELGLGFVGEGDAAKPFEDELARAGVGGLVVECNDQEGQPELRVGEHADGVGQSGETDLDGSGDLLLHLLGRITGIQGDYGDLDIGDIREGLDGERLERKARRRGRTFR